MQILHFINFLLMEEALACKEREIEESRCENCDLHIGKFDRTLTKREQEIMLTIGNVERNPGPKYRFIDKYSLNTRKDKKDNVVQDYRPIISLKSFKPLVREPLKDEVITRVDYSVTVLSLEEFPMIALVIDKPEGKPVTNLETAMIHSSGSTPYVILPKKSVFIQQTFKYPRSIHLYVFSFYEQDVFTKGVSAVECYDVFTRGGSYNAPPLSLRENKQGVVYAPRRRPGPRRGAKQKKAGDVDNKKKQNQSKPQNNKSRPKRKPRRKQQQKKEPAVLVGPTQPST